MGGLPGLERPTLPPEPISNSGLLTAIMHAFGASPRTFIWWVGHQDLSSV